MLEIGVQTKGILPEMDIDRGFKKIHDAGFTRVDINVDCFLKNSDLYDGKVNPFFDSELNEMIMYFLQYKSAMDKYGIKASQMHAPYPVRVEGRWEQNNYMQTVVIPKSIVIAETLGVPWMVVHPFKMQYIYGRERERKENIEYFKLLVPMLKQCKVGICFENLYESVGRRLTEGVCADPEDAVWYIDTLNEYAGEELFGFCLDVGHLQLVKREPYDFIKKMGSRLKILHLHENDAAGDLHQMPFSFGDKEDEGLDWNGIIRGLKETGFNGTLSFETYPTMNSFPMEMSDAVLKMIHDIGVYLAGEIEAGEIEAGETEKI